MINKQMIAPESIIVVGASNNLHKPGGKVLKNLIDGGYKGKIFAVNPKEQEIQGIPCYPDVSEAPSADLAIIAVAAKYCLPVVEELAKVKHTLAFIIISAGFSEESQEGAILEKQITNVIDSVGGCLIGPNCIGILNQNHHSIFTTPIPKVSPQGCDLISGSGATVVYIVESGLPKGLKFSSIFSVGNSAQTGVEEVLEYLDETFDSQTSSRTKILYVESIKNPDKFLQHASSLVRKGCKIAAIKAGTSAAGSRAALSHTGALASSDLAVEALFRKAGIVRCFGREELTTVACVLMHKEIKGKNIAIITHAGGPAVMLTDALSKGGFNIPPFQGKYAEELKQQLLPGSAVTNPIDILATGTAEQLGIAIDYCENHFDETDAIMVIFGSPGLVKVFDAYNVLHQKMETCSKPIFPVLPSLFNAHDEIDLFLSQGHVIFPDEVLLGTAITKVLNTPKPAEEKISYEGVDIPKIRSIIEKSQDGYADFPVIQDLLHACGIPTVKEGVATSRKQIISYANEFGYPLALKAVGPLHKSDVGGVVLNIKTERHLLIEYRRLMHLKDSKGVLIQPMLEGTELFIGAKYEPTYGHVVLCGLGGIFVEVLGDVSSGLAPLTKEEALSMVHSLRGYKIIQGTRGKEGVNEQLFADIIVKLSTMLRFSTEIKELDLNPLIATQDSISVVDARIRIEHNVK
ncbi:MAG: acetate--CoA ligase family protein [Bacteroidota bacterium]|nr:acetate--CoA ligase family protein [Bacteroidota bacterium]